MRVLESLVARPAEAGPAAPAPPVASPAPAVSAPVRELLTWVARRQRTYTEAMAAWRSTCPRYTPWEDALDEGLIQVVSGGGRGTGEDRVRLTPRGHAALAGQAPAPPATG